MLKAFGYIERVGKRPCLHHTCATWNEQPSYIKTMGEIEGSFNKIRLKILLCFSFFIQIFLCGGERGNHHFGVLRFYLCPRNSDNCPSHLERTNEMSSSSYHGFFLHKKIILFCYILFWCILFDIISLFVCFFLP